MYVCTFYSLVPRPLLYAFVDCSMPFDFDVMLVDLVQLI